MVPVTNPKPAVLELNGATLFTSVTCWGDALIDHDANALQSTDATHRGSLDARQAARWELRDLRNQPLSFSSRGQKFAAALCGDPVCDRPALFGTTQHKKKAFES